MAAGKNAEGKKASSLLVPWFFVSNIQPNMPWNRRSRVPDTSSFKKDQQFV